jgi:hypothetical protein
MKAILLFSMTFLFSGLVHANLGGTNWTVSQTIEDASMDAQDVSRIKSLYPENIKLFDKATISYAYYISVRNFIVHWDGSTVCVSNDPRLTVKINCTSVGTTLKDDGSVAENRCNQNLPQDSDPCK